MRGVILAAGRGSRLNDACGELPKCLVTLGGTTLIERQMASLRAEGIDDIVVVVGYRADRVRRVCGHDVTYIENEKYARTNSLYSLWLARALLGEGFVVLNCDVLFHPVLLHDLLSARHEDALLIDYRSPAASSPANGSAAWESFSSEDMKIKVRGGRVLNMSKEMDPLEADGENVGMVKFGSTGAGLLVDAMDRLVEAGGWREWAPRAFSEFARYRPLRAIGTRGWPWIEIDFPADYRRAVREVLPAIDGDRTPVAETLTTAVSAIAAGDLQ